MKVLPALRVTAIAGLLATSGCGASEGVDASRDADAHDGSGSDPIAGAPLEPAREDPADPPDAVTAPRDTAPAPEQLDAPPEEPEVPAGPDLTGWFVGTGHQDVHVLAWRPVGHDTVPRNTEFEMEVLILRDDVPVPGVRLQVTGWMPLHEHGMVRTPVIEEAGDGAYRVSGMLLHMRGSWQVRFQLYAGRTMETVTFDFEL